MEHFTPFEDELMRQDEDAALAREEQREVTRETYATASELDALERSQRMVVIRPDALNKVHDLLDHLASQPTWTEFTSELRATLPARVVA